MGKSKSTKVQRIKWLSSSRDKWLKQRDEVMGLYSTDIVRFGSSETATVLNQGFDSKRKMFYNKLGLYLTKKKSYKLSMGSNIEPLIALSYESWNGDRDAFDNDFEEGIKHRRVQKAKYFLYNPEFPFLVASLDFVLPKKYGCLFTGERTPTDILIECKNPSYMSYREYSSHPKGYPGYYDVQIQQQLMVSKFCKGHLAIIAGSDYFDVKEVMPDIELQKYIDQEVTKFGVDILKAKQILALIREEESLLTPDKAYIETLWGMIQQLEPEVTDSKEDTAFIDGQQYPESNSLVKIADEEDEGLMAEYLLCTEKIGELTSQKQLCRNKLIDKAQDFEFLESESYKMTNRKGGDKKSYFSIKAKKQS